MVFQPHRVFMLVGHADHLWVSTHKELQTCHIGSPHFQFINHYWSHYESSHSLKERSLYLLQWDIQQNLCLQASDLTRPSILPSEGSVAPTDIFPSLSAFQHLKNFNLRLNTGTSKTSLWLVMLPIFDWKILLLLFNALLSICLPLCIL